MSNHPYRQLAIAILAAAALAGCASKPAPKKPTQSAATKQAIQDAQAAIDNTQEPCTGTGNADQLLQQARDAASDGNDARAQDLAGQAKKAVKNAVNDCYLDLARQELSKAETYTNLSDDQQDRLDNGKDAIDNNEGRRAYEILSQLNSELSAANQSYDVERGDTLWGIADQSDVYGNAWEWPLIYKANSDKIKDADLIYPGQKFRISSHPTHDAVDLAEHHAKNRGSWKVGHAEQSDQNYLDKAESNSSSD
jgi:nucleoid-associated protein YgaU